MNASALHHHACPFAQVDSKVVFTFVVLVLWLRFLRFYVVSKSVGPKVKSLHQPTSTVLLLILILGLDAKTHGP